MRPYKSLFYLSLSINIAAGLFLIGKRLYWSYFKNPVTYTYGVSDYMKAMAELQSEFPVDSSDNVFIGNSLTSHFPLSEIFGTHVKNRGVGSNKTADILLRVPGIARNRPARIFLEGGVNDLSESVTVDSIINNFISMIDTIRSCSPRTEIFIQSTLPTGRESLPLMPGIDSLNNCLIRLCKAENIPFIDIGSKLRSGPGMDSSLTWDGIHLTGKGYKIWAEELRRFILLK